MEAGVPQIPVFDVRVGDEELEAVAATLRSGWLSAGPQTEAFEQEFAEHLGSKHVLALSSCTAALHLACIAAGIEPGDEVIVPSLTFVATANAVRYCGARPVFCDIVGGEGNDLNMDTEAVEALITERTKAVIPVHWAGYPGRDRRPRRALRAPRAHPDRGRRPRPLGALRLEGARHLRACRAASRSSRTRCWAWGRAARSAPTPTRSPSGCGACARRA